ncbi:helix-turn-helix domain-containing protein [Segetibacter sp.]|jgi:GTPase SAR1 family protein|uniref:helix-turn-helix domain-containing protein n=1 Tax=Segetibacter sp. TaxID=2231182 RepID=UPI0026021855|nr:helix-turn-helix domain-containing protein [Segetibacter sp.]MCW3079993.1 helicase [Segetibacter sp.]
MNPDASNTIFQKAVAFVNQTNKHLFLTGKAGTGKTTFLKYISDNTFKKMAVVAPTGVAAINARGVTIHSFFQLPFGPFIPTDKEVWGGYGGEINNRASLLKNLRLQRAKRQVIQELDLLIIDEISMVRADLLDAVDIVMRHVRKQPLIPFGGVQMVYIGDMFQLPPVAKQEEWEILKDYYKSPFFFDAQVLQYVPPLYIELKKIYRQKDDVFINILNNIRNNCCTSKDLEILHQQYDPGFAPRKEDNYITLCSHNYKADEINQRELDKLPGKVYSYDAKITGEFYERSYPAEKQLQLKQGAQIMFIKNDKGDIRRFYNGKIGTVTKIEHEKIVVNFPNEEGELEIEQEKWQNVRYNYITEKDALAEEELGTFTQYPIRLAWAITIHKSQGLTFEKAIIDAGASFAAGQVYVSLSRLTSLQGLVLKSRIQPSCISTDSRVVDFVKQELEEDVLQQTLEQQQKVYISLCLMQSFAWERISDSIQTHLESYEDRQIPDKEKCIKWCTELANTSIEQKDVADKFRKQLEYLFVNSGEDGYKKLHERTKAATKYFISAVDQLYQSIQKHINEVKHKKNVKKYLKELQELLVLFNRKKQQLQQGLQLSEALKNSTKMNELLHMVAQNTRVVPAQLPEEIKITNAKPEKGESGRITLQMFKQGKSIEDISAERSMSFGTIESHLAGFIATGEVDILDLVDNATLEKLLAIMESEPRMSASAIKEKAGKSVSYSAISAVRNYQERVKKEPI